jgi:hypothetical protein
MDAERPRQGGLSCPRGASRTTRARCLPSRRVADRGVRMALACASFPSGPLRRNVQMLVREQNNEPGHRLRPHRRWAQLGWHAAESGLIAHAAIEYDQQQAKHDLHRPDAFARRLMVIGGEEAIVRSSRHFTQRRGTRPGQRPVLRDFLRESSVRSCDLHAGDAVAAARLLILGAVLFECAIELERGAASIRGPGGSAPGPFVF